MEKYLKRIADSLERAFPLKPDTSFFEKSAAFIWDPDQTIKFKIQRKLPISLLKRRGKA